MASFRGYAERTEVILVVLTTPRLRQFASSELFLTGSALCPSGQSHHPAQSPADPVASYVAPSARSERNFPAPPSAERARAKSLDIDLRVDGNGVKLGDRVSGNKGVSGAQIEVAPARSDASSWIAS